MYRILQIMSDAEVAQCRQIAATAPFMDGKVTNPHNLAKQNEQLHDRSAYEKSSQLLGGALMRSAEFVDFAFPVALAPPMMTRYKPGMKYGPHADSAFIQLPGATLRSDLSCTIFLNEPDSYDGGELHLTLQKTHKAADFNVAHLLVDDVDALHAVCKQHGARVIKNLQNKDYGLRAFVFEDIDGNRIDVGQVI